MMREEIIGDCRLILGDCREVLPGLGRADAVVTDPPYGIGVARSGKHGGGTGGKGTWKKEYRPVKWDNASPKWLVDYIGSTPSIVWGGNYFPFPPMRGWLVWDKLTTGDFSDCELAWTNLEIPVRRRVHLWNGLARAGLEKRFDHPTQKPAQLMQWCLGFLPNAETILDPFMGSGTTGVACANLGRKFIGIELDEGYFDIACRRIEEAYRQPRLFSEPTAKATQEPLL